MKHIFPLFLALFAPAIGLGQYAISTTTLPIATVNQPYSTVIQTNGNASVTACTVVGGALPTGLGIQAVGSGCTISGTPNTAGSGAFALTVSNNQGQTTASRVFSQAVFGITTLSLPSGNPNVAYSVSLQASGGGGSQQYQWSLVAGSLPPEIGRAQV